MTPSRFVKYLAVGQIRNEFIIDRVGKAHNNIPGGSLLYAGAALKQWGGETGLLGVVSDQVLRENIDQLAQRGLDIRGIKTTSELLNPIVFYAYPGENDSVQSSPVAWYAANQLPLPRELLNYADKENNGGKAYADTRIYPEDIPPDYLDASAAHICPLDLTLQLQLSTMLQRGSIRSTTIQPHPTGMVPEKLEEIALLTKDSKAVITRETDLRALFKGVADEIWEMMERICDYGSQYIVVKNTFNGYSLYQREYAKRFQIPEYPIRRIDPTGQMDVFCAAFLAGLHETYDPQYALCLGAVAASIKGEGTGPFFIMESLPGLDQARVAALRDQIVLY